jgi:FkbM family methyltransferase
MSIKRRIANFVERQLDVRIVRPWYLPLLFEEEHLSRFFRNFQIDCVFDVGANAGQYADMIRDRCGFSGPIVSFEPIPVHADALRKRALDRRDWFIESSVLNRKPGPVDFNITSGDQLSSMNKPQTGDLYQRESVVVQTLRLEATTLAVEFDKYKELLGFRRPFLKMDTQGSDLEVAAGADDRLQQFVGLQSELAFKPLYENIPSADEALTFYRSKGFEISAFLPNNSGNFPALIESDCVLYRVEA